MLDARTGGAVVMLSEATSSPVFSPDERALIASGSLTRDYISIWDIESGRETGRLQGRGAYLALSPDGDTIAGVVQGLGEDGEPVAGTSRDIALWSIAAGRRVGVLGSHKWVRDLAYSPDGSILASGGGGDDVIRLWDPATRREIATLVGHTDGIECLAFSPDGSILASGSDDYTVKLWDVATRQEVATLAGHARDVYSVAFSSDGSTLASGGGDYAVRLWDVASFREKAVLRGHDRPVVMVGFSHEEGRLLSGSNLQWSEDWRTFGDVIRVWDPASQQQVDSFGSVSPSVNSLGFSPDGQTIATTGGNAGVVVL